MTTNLTPHILTAGELQATFWPGAGMLCASLRHRGVELLRRVEDLETARGRGSTAGIPLLYPWANRLSCLNYRAAGREVALDPSSPLLHFDDQRLPMHGVPWSQLRWDVVTATEDTLTARLAWSSTELLAIFPFPHDVEMNVRLGPSALLIQTTVIARPGSPVPVSFGFHPYFGFPGITRAQWKLKVPSMRQLALDARGIPTGAETTLPAWNGPLGNTSYDSGFALARARETFSITGGSFTIVIEFCDGFRYAQIYAPGDKDFIAIEPMTAPTNALSSGQGLRIVRPGEHFIAAFRIAVDVAKP
jgi:aldose 1-epimerase